MPTGTDKQHAGQGSSGSKKPSAKAGAKREITRRFDVTCLQPRYLPAVDDDTFFDSLSQYIVDLLNSGEEVSGKFTSYLCWIKDQPRRINDEVSWAEERPPKDKNCRQTLFYKFFPPHEEIRLLAREKQQFKLIEAIFSPETDIKKRAITPQDPVAVKQVHVELTEKYGVDFGNKALDDQDLLLIFQEAMAMQTVSLAGRVMGMLCRTSSKDEAISLMLGSAKTTGPTKTFWMGLLSDCAPHVLGGEPISDVLLLNCFRVVVSTCRFEVFEKYASIKGVNLSSIFIDGRSLGQHILFLAQNVSQRAQAKDLRVEYAQFDNLIQMGLCPGIEGFDKDAFVDVMRDYNARIYRDNIGLLNKVLAEDFGRKYGIDDFDVKFTGKAVAASAPAASTKTKSKRAKANQGARVVTSGVASTANGGGKNGVNPRRRQDFTRLDNPMSIFSTGGTAKPGGHHPSSRVTAVVDDADAAAKIRALREKLNAKPEPLKTVPCASSITQAPSKSTIRAATQEELAVLGVGVGHTSDGQRSRARVSCASPKSPSVGLLPTPASQTQLLGGMQSHHAQVGAGPHVQQPYIHGEISSGGDPGLFAQQQQQQGWYQEMPVAGDPELFAQQQQQGWYQEMPVAGDPGFFALQSYGYQGAPVASDQRQFYYQQQLDDSSGSMPYGHYQPWSTGC